MNSKIYIYFYIFIFICIQNVSLSFSEDNIGTFKSKEELFFPKNGINTYSDQMSFDVIEESDFFEPKENLQKSNNLNAKKWTITIKLGPFNTKDDALKILSNIRTDSSEKLFESNVGLPKANLYGKVLNFEIVEVDYSKELDKKSIQNNFKNKHLKTYEKPSVPINSNYMIEIKTTGSPLMVRKKPLTTSPIIYRLKNGSKFPLVDKPRYDETEGWVRIEYLTGEFGWISKTYSKITDFSEPEFIDNKVAELNPSPTIENFNAVFEKNKQLEASLGQLNQFHQKLTAEVAYSKKLDKKSIQNKFKNKHLKTYEKPSVPINSNYMIEIKTAGQPLRVRKKPLTTSPIIYRLKNGSKFLLVDKPRYDENEGWVRIEYLTGEFGWVSKTHTKITDFLESEFIDNKVTELKPSPTLENLIIDQVNNWIKAWESNNFKLYLSFYSNNFKGTKEYRQVWEESREHVLNKYLSIDIETKNFKITRSGNNIKVSFIQFFKTDKFSDVGNKVLYWENRETGWKIVKEVWTPL